ncbi:hypothetical protein ZWY2020_000398 [Hordeum vulgare]|nr:hypothetical protein ZWY2020_000398 [Hordeum vulgare]
MAPSRRPLDDAVAEIERLKARVEDVSHRNARYNLIGDSGTNSKTSTTLATIVSKSAAVPDLMHNAANQPSSSAFHTIREVWEAAGKMRMRYDNGGWGDLKKLITKQGSGLEVISLWGSPGSTIGLATSIIRKAYNGPEICQEFKIRAWVKMMHPFNLDKFLKSLLTQFYASSHQAKVLGEEFLGNMRAAAGSRGDDLMKAQVIQHMSDEHGYLVIVEGLSTITMSEWEAIRMYLPDSEKGSRVVVEVEQLGLALSCTGEPYQVAELGQFSDGRSLCAFFKQSWQWNSNTHINPDENQTNANLMDIAPSAKKRLAMGSGPDDTGNLSMVATDKTSLVVQRVDQLEKGQDTKNDPKVTPQKNQNKKKLKAQNGVAIDSIDIRTKGTDGDTYESAANSAQGMDKESTIQNIEDSGYKKHLHCHATTDYHQAGEAAVHSCWHNSLCTSIVRRKQWRTPCKSDNSSTSQELAVEIPPRADGYGGRISQARPALAAAADDGESQASTTSKNRPYGGLVFSRLSKFCRKGHVNSSADDGVQFSACATRGIGKLKALHTLGVVNVQGASGNVVLGELKKLAQLRKLKLCGIDRENWKDFCDAISGHGYLESLSVRLDEEEEKPTGADIVFGRFSEIPEPPRTLKSLKVYVWEEECTHIAGLDEAASQSE